MKRIAVVSCAALASGGAGAWWLLREPPPPVAVEGPLSGERVIGLEKPLPMDETVALRWIDEETGEEDVWQVTKRAGLPPDAEAKLPEPDPDAAGHVPDESARALHQMGLESWKRGEIRDAMEQLAAAIEADPDDPLPRTQYGRLQVLAMGYGEARPHLERAAELDPDDPQVWLDLATLYEKTRALDRAWAARRRAEELVGDAEILQDEMTGFWIVEGTKIHP